MKVSSMKVIVIGSQGMLGQDLRTQLMLDGFEVIGLDVAASEPFSLDITQPENMLDSFKKLHPQLIINCAAYTAVDRAESEPAKAFAVNRDGAANLANACKHLNIPLVHLSTDYVFDGESNRPYQEDDQANPWNVYGLSKWHGEEAIRTDCPLYIILRVSWLFGLHGSNFVKTILRLAREKEELRVVADQIGCPTWTGHVANALMTIAQKIEQAPHNIDWGTYHFCGKNQTSWYGFAQSIIEEGRRYERLLTERVIPISTSEFLTPARRPKWSVLSCKKIGLAFQINLQPWQQGLKTMLFDYYNAHN
jgi:dTDP-4-dehydrorhamnose reductase